MILEKAIEVLTERAKILRFHPKPDELEATMLGIEALTLLERWSSKGEIQPYPLLPSETKD